jgi:uncharacterized glyoxalase superfamily protein PhnB
MTTNRSRPPGTVVPRLVYTDVGDAIEWLCRSFGFTVRFQYGPDDAPAGAFLNVGEGGCVSLTVARTGQSPNWADDRALLRPPRTGEVTHSVGVQVADVDSHYARATRNGVRVFGPPTTHPFGERQYTAEDLAGHRWSFSQSVADVDIADWGGKAVDLS